ncbi:MAG: copper chaperone PCu(A)C [Sandarakinorhabdus sp.]|nr:copper chaperone PCu(A)C [Sandarakinorhabdus sp.]MBS3962662.1 copper chaperone PCu(A)C [Sandarakinorhabdus sp.]
MMTIRQTGFTACALAVLLLVLALFGGRAALAGCGSPHVMDAWVRMPAVTGRPAGGYFVVHGTEKADALVSVASPRAERIELHSMTRQDGVMRMRAEKSFALPAKGTLTFAPGGSHLMLFGLAADVKPGDRIPLTLGFQSGATVTVQADVRSVTAPAPAAADRAHHH